MTVTNHYKVYFTVKTDWNSDLEVSSAPEPQPQPHGLTRSDVVQPDAEVPAPNNENAPPAADDENAPPAADDENAPSVDENAPSNEADNGDSATESDVGEDVPDINDAETEGYSDTDDLVILQVYSLRPQADPLTRPPTPVP